MFSTYQYLDFKRANTESPWGAGDTMYPLHTHGILLDEQTDPRGGLVNSCGNEFLVMCTRGYNSSTETEVFEFTIGEFKPNEYMRRVSLTKIIIELRDEFCNYSHDVIMPYFTDRPKRSYICDLIDRTRYGCELDEKLKYKRRISRHLKTHIVKDLHDQYNFHVESDDVSVTVVLMDSELEWHV